MTESLSDKIKFEVPMIFETEGMILTTDLKEAVKELKKYVNLFLKDGQDIPANWIIAKIKEIFGDLK